MLLRAIVLVPLALATALIAVVATLVLSPHTLLGVGEDTLASSIEAEVGVDGAEPRCRERGERFRCSVGGRAAGAAPRYRVSLDGACWRAQPPGQPGRRSRLEGCVGITDYIRLPDLGSG